MVIKYNSTHPCLSFQKLLGTVAIFFVHFHHLALSISDNPLLLFFFNLIRSQYPPAICPDEILFLIPPHVLAVRLSLAFSKIKSTVHAYHVSSRWCLRLRNMVPTNNRTGLGSSDTLIHCVNPSILVVYTGILSHMCTDCGTVNLFSCIPTHSLPLFPIPFLASWSMQDSWDQISQVKTGDLPLIG